MDKNKKLHYYKLQSRPFSFNMSPKNHKKVIDKKNFYGRHGVIGYENKLSEEEAKKYELIYIGFLEINKEEL